MSAAKSGTKRAASFPPAGAPASKSPSHTQPRALFSGLSIYLAGSIALSQRDTLARLLRNAGAVVVSSPKPLLSSTTHVAGDAPPSVTKGGEWRAAAPQAEWVKTSWLSDSLAARRLVDISAWCATPPSLLLLVSLSQTPSVALFSLSPTFSSSSKTQLRARPPAAARAAPASPAAACRRLSAVATAGGR